MMKLGVLRLDDGEHGVVGMSGVSWVPGVDGVPRWRRKSLDRARAEELDMALVEELLLERGDLAGLDGGRD